MSPEIFINDWFFKGYEAEMGSIGPAAYRMSQAISG